MVCKAHFMAQGNSPGVLGTSRALSTRCCTSIKYPHCPTYMTHTAFRPVSGFLTFHTYRARDMLPCPVPSFHTVHTYRTRTTCSPVGSSHSSKTRLEA